MASVDLLRKLIREEVRAVFQEELAGILKEAIISNKQPQMVSETRQSTKSESKIPGTLNKQAKRVVAPDLGRGNPLTSLLSETAMAMTSDDMAGLSFDSKDAMGFGMMQKEVQTVGSVEEMVAAARPSSNFDMIQINDVPDFTELMSSLRSKGAI